MLHQHSVPAHLVVDTFGCQYELLLSSGTPQYSASLERKVTSREAALQFIRHLSVGIQEWRHLLARAGGVLYNSPCEADILRVCADLAVRKRIRFYQLPKLNNPSVNTREPGWG